MRFQAAFFISNASVLITLSSSLHASHAGGWLALYVKTTRELLVLTFSLSKLRLSDEKTFELMVSTFSGSSSASASGHSAAPARSAISTPKMASGAIHPGDSAATAADPLVPLPLALAAGAGTADVAAGATSSGSGSAELEAAALFFGVAAFLADGAGEADLRDAGAGEADLRDAGAGDADARGDFFGVVALTIVV